MDDLYTVIENVDKDNSFEVLEVLKESPSERTEKVRALNGKEYVRKYFMTDGDFSKEKLVAIANLVHPNLPVTHDFYELADRSVIIQDFITGQRLSDIIENRVRLAPEEVVDIVVSLCDAVECMHDQTPNPLIHRDIKPDNIIIEPCGNLKLIDFGAVREYKDDASRDTVYVGTPGYASPEQFGFGQTDTRTDIYAIGMTMNQMLTGKAPERGKEPSSLLEDSMLSEIVEKATKFDPEERYENIHKLKVDLAESLNADRHTKRDVRANPTQKTQSENKPKSWKRFMPLHVFMIIFMVVAFSRSIINPSEFGMQDTLLSFGEDVTVALFVAFCYILGLNVFDINVKWKFLTSNRVAKKWAMVIVVIFLSGAILLLLQSFHTEAYNLANPST